LNVPPRQARVDQVAQLADGRILGYAEYGLIDGPPLFIFHGFPGSRLAVPEMWPVEPTTVRVIAPDRPGVGLSTPQPGRRLTDWADDIRQLADSLGIERFLVAGFSGGGPHALAVAHDLPGRVIAAASIGGAGPVDTPGALDGMHRGNRVVFKLARKAPAVVWLVQVLDARLTQRRPAKALERAAGARGLPEADRDAMTSPRMRETHIAAAPEAFRQGVRQGFMHELRIHVRPWGFDLTAIKPPVRIWHGDQDANVPLAMAQQLAERIPGSSLTIYPGEGHFIVPKHWDEILATLLSADPRSA
jgi:pimeloyl-ACP methyl ester carboxylesterase